MKKKFKINFFFSIDCSIYYPFRIIWVENRIKGDYKLCTKFVLLFPEFFDEKHYKEGDKSNGYPS